MTINKILILHPILVPYRLDIFNHLAEKNKLDLVLSKRNSAINYFHEDDFLPKLKCNPSFICDDIQLNILSLFRWLKNRISNSLPDIIIVAEFSVISLLCLAIRIIFKTKFKLVVWTDDNSELIKNDKIHRKLLRKTFISQADGWIFVSKEIQKHYINEFKIRTHLSTVLPIIHQEATYNKLINKSKELINAYRTQFCIGNKKIVLFVGRLIKEKSVESAIVSFSKISMLANSLLIIVGTGEEEDNLKKLVLKLDIVEYVVFVGYFENEGLAVWYQLANLLVLPSKYEPFGVVVNEALLCNTPVIVSDKVGAKSLIEEDVNGSIIPHGDIEAFTNKIQDMLTHNKVYENIPHSLMPFEYEQFATSLDEMILRLREF